MNVCSHTGFQPLRTCMVGRCYPPQFFDKIPNPKVRRVIQKIVEETEQDYQTLIDLLKSFGVSVIRPEICEDNGFEEYMLIRSDGERIYQKPPMQPRDDLLIVGNTLFMRRPHGPHYHDFYQTFYDSVTDTKYHSRDHDELADTEIFSPPSITRIGRDLIFDGQRSLQTLSKFFPDYRLHSATTGGHSDSVYCPVKPGLIISVADAPTYSQTFPDWEVVYLPDQAGLAVTGWTKLKMKNGGRWWIPGQENNDDLVSYVDTWFDHWMGYVAETVFDVNMLVVDPSNVILNGHNPVVWRALERHGITPHVCNFRHRFFWDGGLHCITLDVWRDGDQEDYFAIS